MTVERAKARSRGGLERAVFEEYVLSVMLPVYIMRGLTGLVLLAAPEQT